IIGSSDLRVRPRQVQLSQIAPGWPGSQANGPFELGRRLPIAARSLVRHRSRLGEKSRQRLRPLPSLVRVPEKGGQILSPADWRQRNAEMECRLVYALPSSPGIAAAHFLHYEGAHEKRQLDPGGVAHFDARRLHREDEVSL